MASLRIRADGHEVMAVGDRTLVIGRDGGADLPCADDRVSRRHVVVWSDQQSWFVEDAGSTNGTFRDGQRVQRLRIDGPLRLLLGDPTNGVAIDLEPVAPVAAGSHVAWQPPGVAAVPDSAPIRAPDVAALRIRVEGREFSLSGNDVFAIGRDRDCALRIDDARVSRHHAVIRHENGTWVVEDTASTNGTFKDGAPISRMDLLEPVRLSLGAPTDGVPLELAPAVAAVPRTAPGGDGDIGSAPTELELGQRTMVHALMARVRIGRSADNDIVLNDLLVSRHHAELRGDPRRGWELFDVGSSTGTFVNGQRVVAAPVVDGDIVTLGSHYFRLTGGTLEEYVDTGEVSFIADGITVRTAEGRTLLDGVSFVLEKCSFLAVVGASGAGKSTLLNALAGFKPADSGTVICGGRDLYAWYDEMRQRIGYVPQDDILHTQLTVRRALRFAAELRFPPDVPAAERERRIDEVMAELGLTQRADLAISKLSGGQRKRTSIALELLTKPDLLFLDEPTSGLDPGYEKSLMSLLRQLADGGRTVIVITHSLQSLALCDRVLFMAPGGKVAYFGPPQEVLPFFGREDFPDVFSDLETPADHDWKQRYQASPLSERYVQRPLERVHRESATPRAGAPQPPPPRHRWGRQVSTLVRRYATVIASDRVNRILLLIQAPLLASILLLALAPDGFSADNPGALRGAQLAGLFLVTAVTFLGASNAIREIVKEYPIYRRERSVGLSIPAYIASKVVVLSVVTVLQAMALVLIAGARQGGPPSGSALGGPMRVELVIGVALTGLAAMGLGLLISASVQNVDKAITLLPLVLVPQQVLSNPLLQIENKPVLAQLAPVASAQWGYSAVSSTVDMNLLTADANARLPAGAGTAALQGKWNHDARAWLTDAGWLVLILVLELGATAYVLRGRDPKLLGSAVPQERAAMVTGR